MRFPFFDRRPAAPPPEIESLIRARQDLIHAPLSSGELGAVTDAMVDILARDCRRDLSAYLADVARVPLSEIDTPAARFPDLPPAALLAALDGPRLKHLLRIAAGAAPWGNLSMDERRRRIAEIDAQLDRLLSHE